ncbi:unnamed protein product, partial [Symbiodinium sp. KB8]
LEKEKAERLRKRAELKAQRQEEHEKRLESLRAAKTATKAVRRRRIAERLTRRREAQQVWLKLLEEDSKHWIPEDKIDDMITEDTFSMRYPWQYEDYFAVTQRRKLREELYRRGDFTALEAEGLEEEEEGYRSNWDDDLEGEEISTIADEFDLRDAVAAGEQLEEESMKKFVDFMEKYLPGGLEQLIQLPKITMEELERNMNYAQPLPDQGRYGAEWRLVEKHILEGERSMIDEAVRRIKARRAEAGEDDADIEVPTLPDLPTPEQKQLEMQEKAKKRAKLRREARRQEMLESRRRGYYEKAKATSEGAKGGAVAAAAADGVLDSETDLEIADEDAAIDSKSDWSE